jgi:MFS family permease
LLFKTYRGLPTSVYILFLARIINRMGDFVKIFLTLYLTRYLNMSSKETGLIITLIGLFSVAGNIVGGKITDHTSRKKILLFSQTFSAITVGFCGFIPNSEMLPWILIAFNFFNGAARPVSTAMLTDLTTTENRAQSFSLLYLGINIGVSIGPLAAGFLFNNYRQWIFWGDSITTLLSVLLILIFVPDLHQSQIEAHSPGEAHENESLLKALLKRPVLLIYSVLALISSFVYSQHSFSLPLILNDVMNEQGARFFGIIMSVNAVSVLVMTPTLTAYLHKQKPLLNMAAGQLCYAIGFGMLFFASQNYALFIISTVIWTLGEILNAINSGVFIANHTPINYRGRFSGFFGTMKSAGYTLAPLISGIILESTGLRFIWLVTFVVGMFLFITYRSLESWDRKLNKIPAEG